MGKVYYVYILECIDQTFYVGVTNNLDRRISEHKNKTYRRSYTSKRLPIKLVKSFIFNSIYEAIGFEKKIKNWSQAKKKALIRDDWDGVSRLSKKNTQ